MPAPETIIPLDPSQQAQAARLICQAFNNDPAGFYVTPDASRRALLLSWYARTGLILGFSHGDIFTNTRLTGVAVWLRPGCADLTGWTLLQAGILPPFRIGPAALWRFFRAMDCFSRVHRQHVPEKHWYLLILTVAPACQGQGLGERLIRPILERADAAALPGYLETANPRAVPFYLKHGFTVVEQAQLPGSSIPFWGLRREPH